MTTPHALVSGASIAGLSTAFWLGRAGWDVTVVERADAFRDGGQNVDVRGKARDVLDRMGLEDDVRRLSTTEEGTAVLDDRGARSHVSPSRTRTARPPNSRSCAATWPGPSSNSSPRR